MRQASRGRRRALLAALLLAAAPAACHSGARPRRVAVAMSGMAFVPAVDTVSVGDTVIWTNQDIVPHTATGPGIETGLLNQGASGRFVAAQAGTLEYSCDFHPTMKARLVVR